MLKRGFDVLVSLIVILIFSPIMIVISMLILVYIGRPIFFSQRRAGFKGRVFNIIKFRTMNNKTDSAGNLLPDNERLHWFGKFLRSTSLDELPEIINVLKGEMSLVGPRPLLEEYLPLYSQEQARRHEVKPGITGLAQVSGRNTISWEDKFTYDIQYVDTHNIVMDIKILFLTLKKVLLRDGINQAADITADKFRG